MKTKRTFLAMGIILLALVSFHSEAFSWGWAVHAYVDDHIGKKRGLNNLNEIYGGMVPDLFNNYFDNPHNQDLFVATHYDFMKVWDAAKCRWEKPVPYGFVSHNELWGVDSTAHRSGRTLGQDVGYVNAKAIEMLSMPLLPDGLVIPEGQLVLIYHGIVENAVDILLKRMDDTLGRKMIYSAWLRSPETPLLLIKAYAKDFSPYFGGYFKAARAITKAEWEFRKTIIAYGEALMQDDETAIQLLSEQMVDLAESFLGQPLPLPRDQAVAMIAGLTELAMGLCADDFSGEVEATIQKVDQELEIYSISY